MIREIGLPNSADELTSEIKDMRLPTEEALLVVDMKDKLNNDLVDYRSAAIDISDSFRLSSLNIFIKLFDTNDSSKYAQQKSIVVDFLNHVIPSLNITEVKLNGTSAGFKASIEKLAALQARYKNKSNGESESINRVCDLLKDRFTKISDAIDEFNEKLKGKAGVINDLRSQVKEATANPTTSDELRDSLISSIQKLKADYEAFSKILP